MPPTRSSAERRFRRGSAESIGLRINKGSIVTATPAMDIETKPKAIRHLNGARRSNSQPKSLLTSTVASSCL